MNKEFKYGGVVNGTNENIKPCITNETILNKEQIEQLNDLIKNSKNAPLEISKIIDENFWEILL